MIEIRLPKCRLFLTEAKVESLLKHDRELWEAALRRGKAIVRAWERNAQQRKEGERHG